MCDTVVDDCEGAMAQRKKRKTRSDPWEDGRLGADERFVAVMPQEENARVDEAMGLQMISIRLSKRLIDELKVIAQHNGIGYQPLMRNVLSRFARGELIQVLRQQTEMATLENRNTLRSKPGRVRKVA